jgi:hypothetical protein
VAGAAAVQAASPSEVALDINFACRPKDKEALALVLAPIDRSVGANLVSGHLVVRVLFDVRLVGEDRDPSTIFIEL